VGTAETSARARRTRSEVNFCRFPASCFFEGVNKPA
jgi:hypothetical protein